MILYIKEIKVELLTRMRQLIILLIFLLISCSKQKSPDKVKVLLSEQLKKNHTEKDWYVPIGIAIEDLSEEQASWRDSIGNHSICEIVSHLIFWNQRILIAFQGNTPPDFDDNNEETFTMYCNESWKAIISKMDSIQTSWESDWERASQEQITEWGSSVASMSSHMAYHTGQIVYIRKQNGWWEESRGVK